MKSVPLLRTALVIGALLAAPGLHAQESRWERVEQTYSAQAATQIREVVGEAADRGVPPEPLLDKALEGAAKGVAPALVLRTLSEYAGRLERAGALIEAPASRGELVAAAEALRRGVPDEAVRGIAAGGGDDAIALVVLADLVEMEVPVERAREVVAEAMERGAEGDRLLTVPAAVRRLIREGALPPEAASRVQEAMARGGFPGQLPGAGPGAPPGATPPVNPPVPPGAGPPEGKGRPPGPGGPPGGG